MVSGRVPARFTMIAQAAPGGLDAVVVDLAPGGPRRGFVDGHLEMSQLSTPCPKYPNVPLRKYFSEFSGLSFVGTLGQLGQGIAPMSRFLISPAGRYAGGSSARPRTNGRWRPPPHAGSSPRRPPPARPGCGLARWSGDVAALPRMVHRQPALSKRDGVLGLLDIAAPDIEGRALR